MAGTVITKQLSLAIRLVDTTTGAPVQERNAAFRKDGVRVTLQTREAGFYLLLNQGRENFLLQVNVYGYEEKMYQVDYAALDPKLPALDIHLIPKEDIISGADVLSFQGMLEGICELDAVPLSTAHCFTNEYEARKKVLQLFNPHNIAMNYVHYGILNREETAYEKIEISKEISKEQVLLKEPLKKEFDVNNAVRKIVFGETDEKGGYRLRVRDDSTKLNYLIRYVVNGEEKFKKVDFHKLEETIL